MNNIDPADYIEAPSGSKSLKFGDEKQQAKFELGVCMAVHKWDELNTAVDNSWGGANSNEKRDWISAIVIELFDEKLVDVQLIEETLLYAMLDEFDTQVDNDSALEIGALIVKMYRDVKEFQYSLIDSMYSKWQEKQSRNRVVNKVVVQTDLNNPSSEDEDEDTEQPPEGISLIDDSNTQSEDMDVDSGPVIDEDGFELVQKKGRRRH